MGKAKVFVTRIIPEVGFDLIRAGVRGRGLAGAVAAVRRGGAR